MKLFNKKIFHLKKIKKVFEYIKEFVVKYKSIIIMSIPFILMEIFVLMFTSNIGYTNYKIYAPILFTISWIALFIGVSLSFKNKIGKTIYIVFCLLFLSMFLVDGVYYYVANTFFDFYLVESASEGAPYMIESLKNCNPFIYVGVILVIISIIYTVKKMPKIEKNNYKLLGIVVLAFAIIHTIIPVTLGKADKSLTWSSWKNTRNIYNSYNDNNKSLKVSGFYEYTIRNFYITFLKPEEKINAEEMTFLDTAFEEEKSTKNSYTGKYKGMNLILLQLEGIDNWVINKSDTPTLYKLMNNSINFTNHYSYYNGGGSTFNSEFAVNTGLITPLSYTKNAYTFNKNNFPNTLANLFKGRDYSVNAYHMNSGEYYSRTVNYVNWGYDNYYGLIEVDNYTDNSYQLDRELMLNEKFNSLYFPEEGNFVDYIITYSNHMPFSTKSGVCKSLIKLDNENELLNNPEYVETEIEMSEEDCVRRQAAETDYMVSMLIDKLKENNLYDNTVIVAFADHYLYTLEDKTILDRYKNTSNNLINNTPFFIWTSKTKKKNINKVTSQLNILPTVLNLFGFEYNVNNYIGKDALAKNYDGIVFFNDYSWYDGNVYVTNGEVTNGKKINDDELEEKNAYISNITKKNDLALKYNYFK